MFSNFANSEKNPIFANLKITHFLGVTLIYEYERDSNS